jgi:hypothetical protein
VQADDGAGPASMKANHRCTPSMMISTMANRSPPGV